MVDHLVEGGQMVESLGISVRYGGSGLDNVPGLLKWVLENDAWREFVTPQGVTVTHDRFVDFVTTEPIRGLGTDLDMVERIVGTEDPELLDMLRDAQRVGKGRRTNVQPAGSADGGNGQRPSPPGINRGGSDRGYIAGRLKRERPDLFDAVRDGTMTLHGAAVAAGFRPRATSVRLDDTNLLVNTLQKKIPERLREIRDEIDRRLSDG